MTRREAVSIPARLTADELAGFIGAHVDEVTAELRSRGEPDSPDDLIGGELAKSVARQLGARVVIESRDLALEALYEYETRGELLGEMDGRALRLATGVIEMREDLDSRIEEASEHWTVARMPMIDRNILRLGLYELETELATPAPVIISEAVRLANAYSTERSASFVNGVLASLASSTRG